MLDIGEIYVGDAKRKERKLVRQQHSGTKCQEGKTKLSQVSASHHRVEGAS